MSRFEEIKRDFGSHRAHQTWRVPVGSVRDDPDNGVEDCELVLDL